MRAASASACLASKPSAKAISATSADTSPRAERIISRGDAPPRAVRTFDEPAPCTRIWLAKPPITPILPRFGRGSRPPSFRNSTYDAHQTSHVKLGPDSVTSNSHKVISEDAHRRLARRAPRQLMVCVIVANLVDLGDLGDFSPRRRGEREGGDASGGTVERATYLRISRSIAGERCASTCCTALSLVCFDLVAPRRLTWRRRLAARRSCHRCSASRGQSRRERCRAPTRAYTILISDYSS